MFLLFWWHHQHNASFFDKYSPNFSCLSKILLFDTDYEKVCYSWNIFQNTCDNDSIYMWIELIKLIILLLCSNITSSWPHNDFKLDIWAQIWDQSIKFSMYTEFQLIMLSIGVRYCNVTQKEPVSFRPSAWTKVAINTNQ